MRSMPLKLAGVIVTALLWTACAGNGPTVTPSPEPANGSEGGPMVRGRVFLNETELQVMESYPIQLAVHLEGDLPTPCHQLEWEATGPDEEGNLHVEVYSEAPADQECIQVLEPFEENLQLGSVEGGTFTIFVNGEEIGTVEG